MATIECFPTASVEVEKVAVPVSVVPDVLRVRANPVVGVSVVVAPLNVSWMLTVPVRSPVPEPVVQSP